LGCRKIIGTFFFVRSIWFKSAKFEAENPRFGGNLEAKLKFLACTVRNMQLSVRILLDIVSVHRKKCNFLSPPIFLPTALLSGILQQYVELTYRNDVLQ